MPYAEATQPEHWPLLIAFFALFAVHGLSRRPGSTGPCVSCIALGLLAVAANASVLLVVNRIGYGAYPVTELVLLQRVSIESSLIILGYCVVIRGIALFLRYVTSPNNIKMGRTYL